MMTPLGGGPHVSVIASTMGSSLIRYTIEVPIKDLRYTGQNRAFPAGKHAQRLMLEMCLSSLLIWFDEFFLHFRQGLCSGSRCTHCCSFCS